LSETMPLLIYIGSIVIRRSIWVARNRSEYYGTLLVHMGVIFQQTLPGDTLVIAQPLISYRDGNPRTFWSKMFEIFWIILPRMIYSFAISEQIKIKYSTRSIRLGPLFYSRAMGWYSLSDYRRWTLS